MVILSKACNPDNFELHNSLKPSFTNIQGLLSNFIDYKSFLELNSPDILALCETNLDDSTDSGNFPVICYLPLFRKILVFICMVLQFILKKDSFCMGLISLENSADSCLCFRLALFHTVPYFYFLIFVHGFWFYFI